MEVVTDQDLHRALASKSGIPFVSLSDYDVDPEAIKLVTRDIASKYLRIPIRLMDQKLVVAMEDPFNTEIIDTIQSVTNLHLELVTAAKESIEAAIATHYEVDTFEQDVIVAEDVQRLFSLDKKQERVISEEQKKTFEETMELNFSISVEYIGRFRVNLYRQRGETAMVIRFIKSRIPSIEELKLPTILKQLVVEPRGLVLLVGSTGSGKSTTGASMASGYPPSRSC